MEYSQQEWLAFLLSILTAYALAGWINKPYVPKEERTPGDGYVIGNGFYSLMVDGKPYNSGDPRAG